MAKPQSLRRFMLRRLWIAMLLFFILILGVYAATYVYYTVLINIVQKHGDFATAAVGDNMMHFTRKLVAGNALLSRFFSSALYAADEGAPALPVILRRSSRSAYGDVYKVLQPGIPLMRQRVRNPSLPENVPIWDEDSNHVAKERDVRVGNAVPSRQRYIFAGLEPGRRYMTRLSFLGSPSVAFELVLYQVRRSRVVDFLEDGVEFPGTLSGRAHGWVDEPQDTELLMFSTSPHSALELSADDVWVDREDMNETLGVSGTDAADLHRVFRAASSSDDPFLPVIEVRPRALSMPMDGYRFPVALFNIEVEEMSLSFLPSVALPLITYAASVLIFVGYTIIYTFVSSGIAGGVRIPQST